MTHVCRYWRPRSIDDAFLLLDRPYTVVVGGGTRLHELHHGPQAVEVVDLQDVLTAGSRSLPDGSLTVGAGTTLQEFADDDRVPPPLRMAARRERPSTLRAQANIGSFVARPPLDSLLLATLLAYGAEVDVSAQAGARPRSLHALLGAEPLARGEIATAVRFPTSGQVVPAVTARTPADRPIVSAVGRREGSRSRLVLAGVAGSPIVVDDPDGLDPAVDAACRSAGALDDHRGSADYRRALARVLAARVTAGVAP